MSSVRAQIFAARDIKLEAVRAALDWQSLIRNPREPLGEDQMNAIIVMDGGDREPADLTGHVEVCWAEFSVGLMVKESGGAAEELLDAGLVAVLDALLDPHDIQLGGIAIAIQRQGISDPIIGRGPTGARILAGQSIDFAVQYMAREGDASTPGP